MSGMAISHSLAAKGVENVKIFESSDTKGSSHWIATARMPTLRSGKHNTGPALGDPSLEFKTWFLSRYGEDAWTAIDKIPTPFWAEYLDWYRQQTQVKIEYNADLEKILPELDGLLRLEFKNGYSCRARHVVLATGRGGWGGLEIPEFMNGVPKSVWAHTGEPIDPFLYANARVCVIGSASSAYDAAATALESGAKHVHMLMRRKQTSDPNPLYLGFDRSFFFKGDERAMLFKQAWQIGFRPPPEAFDRIEKHQNFTLHPEIAIQSIETHGKEILINTNQGIFSADFLILATGYAIDGQKVSSLSAFFPQIRLWSDHISNLPAKLGRFPYLGPHFEFLEKHVGEAPFLSRIHCFNFGAFMSHGRISGDIDQIHHGIERIALGIASCMHSH